MTRPWWKRLLFGPTDREIIREVLSEPGIRKALRVNQAAKRILRNDGRRSLRRELEALERRRG
jgi:hypothetical protein